MKRKILNILFITILIIGLTGCNSSKNNNDSSKTYLLGDKVETDIVGFKLLAGKYTYALVRTSGDDLGIAKEFDASEDNRSPYVASKGHTLVAITFYVENLDRSSINLDYNFIKVKYDGKEYSNDIKYVSTSTDNLNWEKYSSSNILLLSNEKKYYRCYIDIDSDIKDLDSTVELIITLSNSKNEKETFNYSISKNNRDEYKGEELTEEVAIKNYNKKVVKEYFKTHINDYSILTGEEIKTVIVDKKFNVYTNTTHAKWTFESTGSIHEGEYVYANKRSYEINENNLVLHWINGRKETNTNTVEVRKINNNSYLLVENGETFGIIFK